MGNNHINLYHSINYIILISLASKTPKKKKVRSKRVSVAKTRPKKHLGKKKSNNSTKISDSPLSSSSKSSTVKIPLRNVDIAKTKKMEPVQKIKSKPTPKQKSKKPLKPKPVKKVRIKKRTAPAPGSKPGKEGELPIELQWIREDPKEQLLSRFVESPKGTLLGESIGIDKTKIIIKHKLKFYSIPLKSIKEKDDKLVLTKRVNWERAAKLGELWRKDALGSGKTNKSKSKKNK